MLPGKSSRAQGSCRRGCLYGGCFPYWPAAGVERTVKLATWIVGKCTAPAGVQAWPAFFCFVQSGLSGSCDEVVIGQFDTGSYEVTKDGQRFRVPFACIEHELRPWPRAGAGELRPSIGDNKCHACSGLFRPLPHLNRRDSIPWKEWCPRQDLNLYDVTH